MAITPIRACNTKANYDAESKHLDMIFFATDTHEILVNGEVYGMSEEDQATLESLQGAYVDAVMSGNTLTLTKLDGTTTAIPMTEVAGNDALSTTLDNNTWVVALAIDPSDKVLSQSSSGLLTTLSLNWNTTDKVIELIGNDSAVISSIDATEFVKDGILDSVVLSTEEDSTYMTFTFNTDAGKSDIKLDVTDLVDVYTAGNGISIDSNVVSVVVDSDSEDFLTVSESGVKLSGVQDAIDTAKSELQEEMDTNFVTAIHVGNSEGACADTLALINSKGDIITTASLSQILGSDAISVSNTTNANRFVVSLTIDSSDSILSQSSDGLLATVGINYDSDSKTIQLTGNDSAVIGTADLSEALEDAGNYTVNGYAVSTNPVLNGADIALTGYEAGTDTSDIEATDTVNSAISKLSAQLEEALAWYEA